VPASGNASLTTLALYPVEKLKLFLIADGVIVVAGLILFVVLYLRRTPASQFRDDLWAEKKKQVAEAKRQAAEDKVDQKILLEHRPEAGDPDEKTEPMGPRVRPLFRTPNFRGKAHEVLGVPREAERELVLKAYKHWIKRYHPDRVSHLGQKYVDQARRRAEQLNSARDELLAKLGKA
jgi:DnaJ-domain-containing protein 1